ncbi:MAG TPA: glycosyltransferase WbuB, partial [Leucothrix sp.]|nr:glycosyltransferase WbuB [Leucothrix sp.]
STPEGAAGTRSFEMASALVKAGHQVTMVCGSFGGGKTGLTNSFVKGMRKGVVNNIEVIEFELPYSNHDGLLKRTGVFLKFALKSIKVALTEQFDLVFATSTPLTAGIPGIFARWLRGKKFVFEVRDLWPELPREMGVVKNPVILWAMGILEWASYRSAHACIGLSPGIVEGIKKRGIKDSKVTMIPNGCDLDLFSSNKIVPKRPKGIDDKDLMAVFTGTHGLANGVGAALDAAAELLKRGRTDIKLCFIGQGKEKPSLIERAKAENLENCIFLDSVPKTELVSYLKGADIGLQMLRNIPVFYYGTSPNKFFDYIAAGLPVLNNYPGWLAGMIKEHSGGFAIPADNIMAYADALEYAANNRDELKIMGENNQELAQQQFSRKKLSADFVLCLESANI